MGILTEILKRPSQRTQLEAMMAGLSILLITSTIIPIYTIFFTDSSLLIKLFTGFGGVGIFIMMFSNLSMTYIQYHSYKIAMDLYTPSQKLLMKLEEAKVIKDELNNLIKEINK